MTSHEGGRILEGVVIAVGDGEHGVPLGKHRC